MNFRASMVGFSFPGQLQKPGLRGTVIRVLRGGLALSLAVLLLPVSEGDLLAQQAPPPPDQRYGQYPSTEPPPQYGQQPQYDPPQQQPYDPQQSYPQQPYDQAAPPAPDAYPEQGYGDQQGYPPADQSNPQPQLAPQQPLSPEQLQQLVAPIALYPDALVAQVLAASTYPLEITEADRWRQAQGNAPPEAIAAGANMQEWDPSIKALTAFPQVLEEMDQDLQWTTELGNAYYNQPQDVLAAVQTMRQRAMAAGTLQDTPQETVTEDQGYVEVEPANPQVVYVPAYNPWVVYGAPVAPYPGFTLGAAIGSMAAGVALGLAAPVVFGVGMVMGAFAGMTWGFLGWGMGWDDGAVFFHGEGYCPHSWTVRDWGLEHGGPRYFGRFDRAGYGGFGRGRGTYGRGGAYGRGGVYGRRVGGYGQYGRGFAGNHGVQGFRGGQYGRSPQQALNRMPTFNARGNYGRPAANYGYRSSGRTPGSYGSQVYGRTASPGRMTGVYGRNGNAYRPGVYGRPGQSFYGAGSVPRTNAFVGRQPQFGGGFRGSAPAYRAPAQPFRQPSFGGRSSRGFGGFSGNSGRSGGFHLSGGGHSSRSFGGGSHFGGGHFGGGHFGGHGGGGHGRR